MYNPTRNFEQSKFTALQYHFDYETDNETIPLQGETYHRYIERMKLYWICERLTDPRYITPFFKCSKLRYNGAKTTRLGHSILDFLARREFSVGSIPVTFHNELSPDMKTIIAIADAALSRTSSDVAGLGSIQPLPITPSDYPFTRDEEIDTAVTAYGELANRMRSALCDSGMRTAVKNFRRNALERRRHLMKVAHLAWERHTSILLLRLDWGFKKTEQYSYILDPIEFHACLAQVADYRQKKLLALRAIFKNDLAFYAWKVEYCDMIGVHMHWLLGIANVKYEDRINIGLKIQQQWDAAIGVDKSYTFNINSAKNAEQSGLRVLHAQDPELWEVVGRYIDYFLKSDLTSKLRTPTGMRSFGSSKSRTSTTPKAELNRFVNSTTSGGML